MFRAQSNHQEKNMNNTISFKMRLSSELQEKIKKEEFKNNTKRMDKYNKLLYAAYPNTEDTTLLHAKKNKNGGTDLFISSELAPEETCFLETVPEKKNLAKSILSLCSKTVDMTELKLFKKIIKEKVRNYENPRVIKNISDNFEKDPYRKRDEFCSIVDSELETRDRMTGIGGGRFYH